LGGWAKNPNLGRRLLDVVDLDVQVEAVLEGLRLSDALEGNVRVVRACLRQTDVVGRFAQGTVDLETEDCTPEAGKALRVTTVNLDLSEPSERFHPRFLPTRASPW